jgi:two-component sensor histidine kinase
MKFWLLVLLLACSLCFAVRAEPFYPFLGKPEVDSLRAKLWQTPPSTARIRLLLRLSSTIITQSPLSYMPMDTGYVYSQQARGLSEKLHYAAGQIESECIIGSYFLSNYQVTNNQVEEGKKLILQAMTRSRQQHSLFLEAQCWRFLSYTAEYSTAGDIQRYFFYAQAAQCYQRLHNQPWEAYTRKQMADVHLRQGKLALAKVELQQVISLYRACGYRRLHYTFDLLAATSTSLANYKDALQYSLASIRVARESQDSTLIGNFYHRTASIYQELNQQQKSLEYEKLALRSHHEAAFPPFYCIQSALSIANHMIALNQPKQALAQMLKERQDYPARDAETRFVEAEGLTTCYLALKQYTLAATYSQPLHELLARKQTSVHYLLRARVCLLLGRLYVAEASYTKARPYLTQALTSYKLASNQADMAITCLILFKADSAQGHYPAAIAHYQRYKNLTDSIFSEKNSKQVAGLQIQYDTKKKEQSIALLTKQSLLQQMTIRQRGFQRNAFVIGTALLVLVLGLGYNRYRVGQRSNRLLEEKQQLLQAQQAEISQKNQSLEQVVSEKETLLTEKEWMLKEIHHRVKNNLQVISSLLTNQSNYLRDPLASAAIRESRNRVQAMALIHQRLYQTDTLARVNMAAYVREIVNSLLESFDRFDTVTTQLNVAAVELEIALATPLGLIVNEAVTNVLKYAFHPAGRGTLTIALTEGPAHHYQLTIADNGVGLPPDFDLDQSHSLGLTIIKGLSTQIGGDLRIESTNGVRVSLQFKAAKSVVPVG